MNDTASIVSQIQAADPEGAIDILVEHRRNHGRIERVAIALFLGLAIFLPLGVVIGKALWCAS